MDDLGARISVRHGPFTNPHERCTRTGTDPIVCACECHKAHATCDPSVCGLRQYVADVRTGSPWVQRAIAGTLPASDRTGTVRA